VIQPFETGVVRAIHVRDGREVKAGEVLIELDSTMNAAESAHLRSDLNSAELDVARLTAALAENGDPVAAFHPPEDAPPTLIATQRQYLLQQVAEHRAKLAALDGQKEQRTAELTIINATVRLGNDAALAAPAAARLPAEFHDLVPVRRQRTRT
jgi:hemolysin D